MKFDPVTVSVRSGLPATALVGEIEIDPAGGVVTLKLTEPKALVQGDMLSWELGTLQPHEEKRLMVHLVPESKGRIAPGYDADLVLVDPTRPTVYAARAMRSKQRHSALEGLRSSFSIRSVYLRGAPAGRAAGRYVPPATLSPAHS